MEHPSWRLQADPPIIDSLAHHNPDLVVLTEYRSDYLADLEQGLKKIGLPHVITTNPLPKVNGILVASREPLPSCHHCRP